MFREEAIMRYVRNCLLVLVAVFPIQVFAADLYGKAWVSPGSKPAGKARIDISCPGGVNAHALVDKYGRYRLTKLPQKKDCQLWIAHRGTSSGKVRVYSGTGSKSMNIELRKSGQDWKLVIH